MNTKRFSIGTVILLAGCYAASDRFIVFNSPPAVTILLPAEGSLFEEDEGIVFQGRVSDNQPVDTLLITWESSIDGPLASLDLPDPDGYLELATASLSPGDHVVTLRAIDDDGDQGEARVTIHIEEAPEHPSIEVIQPQNNGQGLENFPYEFLVRVDDHQTPVQELIVDSVWAEGGSGTPTELCFMVPDTTGLASCSETLPNGTYLLTFTVTDLDGFFSSRNVVFEVVAEGDYDGDGDGFTPNGGDCNDDLDTVHPGATEICDGLDNDCLPTTNIDQGSDCYDDDSDNYCERGFSCVNASGVGADCNDLQPFIHPNAVEVANGIDDDCDGLVDEGTSKWDDDLDGYCEAPPCVNVAGSTASSPSDCNDNNAQIKPSTTAVPWNENCNTAVDDDCDGATNEQNAIGAIPFYSEIDGDGYYRSGAASQLWCFEHYPYTADTPGDCDDNDIDAHPGQTAYFVRQRSSGGWDFNCNNQPEKRWGLPTTCVFDDFSCDPGGNVSGWNGSVPPCGGNGTFVDSCEFDYWTFIAVCAGSSAASCASCIISGTGCGTCLSDVLSNCPGALACDPSGGGTPRLQECR